MTVTDQEAYYLLSRISGIGPKTAQALLEYFGTSEELLHASQEAFRNMGQSAQMKLLEFSNPVWRKNRLEERDNFSKQKTYSYFTKDKTIILGN